MIRKINLIEELAPFGGTVFGCRILSTAEAYGMDEPFAQFWVQENHAAICKLDDAVALEADDAVDFDELRDLIRMTGAKRLLCGAAAAQRLGLPEAVSGEVMVYQNNKNLISGADYELNPSLRELYALLCDCATETFTPPEFEPFYMDLSHRIRHKAAMAVGVRAGGILISCAICTALTADRAVVSSVATKPEIQRKGYGRAALAALITQLTQKEIYILRARNENEEFYRSFGFEPAGGFAELIL